MDNNFENNTSSEGNTPDPNISQPEQPVYTDPNADAHEEKQSAEGSSDSGFNYGEAANAQNGNSSEQNNSYQGYWDNQSQQAQGNQETQYDQNPQYNNQQYNQNTQNSAGGMNYNYNVNPNQTYNGEEGYDTTPLSMGDWVLIILAALIPCCGGIILYFVWAFSKKGNLNRRNYCRAALIIQGAWLVIGIILALIWGSAFVSFLDYYYYY